MTSDSEIPISPPIVEALELVDNHVWLATINFTFLILATRDLQCACRIK